MRCLQQDEVRTNELDRRDVLALGEDLLEEGGESCAHAQDAWQAYRVVRALTPQLSCKGFK